MKNLEADMNTNKNVEEFFVCECSDITHQMLYTDFPNADGSYDVAYLEIHMAQSEPWYKRIWIAIKYVFGYRTKYGHWDTILFKDADLIRFRNALNKSIKNRGLVVKK